MKMKLVLLIAATVLSISVLSACGNNSKQTNQAAASTNSSTQKAADHSTASTTAADQKAVNTSAASNSSASAQASTGKLVEITVNAKDFEYDKKVLHVKKGDKVKLTLKSDDDGGHGFALPAYNINLQKNGSAEFTADKTGTYEYHCSVMCGSGHTNMTGKLVVE
ncbi:cupredoxin domain-containing protein [Bacillus sp. EB600]|uniref:cupredoxin domain-containing protein n=1 Tax=Bacillus sp. EB600 TaxID=2806345 RepID=UPI00210E7D66|nr:cupredoxin domain-containing protein [Bacillus sp. EB600]MCQ6278642.1 cupredoxin domain-containing protein [Bacillus sp. EB600]